MTTYIGQPADQYRFTPRTTIGWYHEQVVVCISSFRKTASFPPVAPPLYSPLKGLTLIAKKPQLYPLRKLADRV